MAGDECLRWQVESKMRYSVFHTQLHHDSRQVYRNVLLMKY